MGKTLITDAGLVERKSFFKRMFCTHYWHNTHIPDPLVFMTGKFEYVCLRCGKEKAFRNDAINFGGVR